MPYKNADKARANALERKRRYNAKKHIEHFGSSAGDMRGRHGNHAMGPRNGRWNAEKKILSDDGYVKVRVGRDHPLADPNGYAYEHLLVWISAGNPLPGLGELLHHKDENRENNRIGNLELKTRSKHATDHNSERGRDGFGRFLPKRAGRLLDGREWNEFPEVRK